MRSRTANWFICKIRYEKLTEDGLQKKVTEQYVVNALSFTEAEARIIEEISQYISGEFEVVEIDDTVFQGTMIDYKIASISETNIEDVFEYTAKK